MRSAELNLARIDQAFLSTHHIWEFWSPDNCPHSLLALLSKELPDVSSDDWPERLRWGGVFLNGQDTRQDALLTAPCRVEYYAPKFAIQNASDFFPAWNSDFILYQDADVLVAFKPAKLSSVPSRDQSDYNLKSYLEAHLGQKVHMPSRLDLSTSGLMLISLNPAINSAIQKIFERRLIEKYYLLQVQKRAEWEKMVFDAAIGRDKRHPVLRKVVKERGKQASTEFFRLDTGTGSFLVAKPHTGRTHQIRVHAQALGHPIVGDNFYAGPLAESLHLLSYRVKFPHPRGNKIIDITTPLELAPLWSHAALSFALRIS